MEEQAVELLLEQAKVKEVKKSFDEIMNKQA
jgi:trigger factor